MSGVTAEAGGNRSSHDRSGDRYPGRCMVGVSRKDIAAIVRWWGGLRARSRVLILASLAVAALGLTLFVLNARQEARLVRADADSLPAQPALMRYAVDHGRGLFQSR